MEKKGGEKIFLFFFGKNYTFGIDNLEQIQ